MKKKEKKRERIIFSNMRAARGEGEEYMWRGERKRVIQRQKDLGQTSIELPGYSSKYRDDVL